MNWLKRMPTSVSLPPSPTKSLGQSDNESVSSTEFLDLTVSKKVNKSNEPNAFNSTKVLKSLRDKSSTVPLQQKADLASLPTDAASVPEREASIWPFRSSPARATASTSSSSEVADHFSRPVSTTKEHQMRSCERQEACEERVRKMRACLKNEVHTAIARKVNDPFTVTEKPESSRRRIDSGTDGHIGKNVFRELQKLDVNIASNSVHDKSTALIPFEEDFLNWTIFRVQNHNMPDSACVGCANTHRSSLHQRHATVWLLHGCKHFLYDSCFEKLRRIEPVYADGACYNCETFKRELKRHSQEEMELRYERLLERTFAQYYYCQMDHRKMTSRIRMK